jgi:dolichol-phosphate mannosyltransferase
MVRLMHRNLSIRGSSDVVSTFFDVTMAFPRTTTVPIAWPTWQTRAVGLIMGTTLLRAAFAGLAGLTDTEAYYASWARVLDWSYYDHPPLIAWMVALTRPLAAGALGIRIGSVVCGALFAIAFHRFAARLFSPRAAFFALVALLSLPAFFLMGFVLNPEAVLAPLWMLALSLLVDLRDRDEPWRPIALGAAIGAGFLAKYTAVLMVPIAIAWLASSARTRRWFRRPSFYAGGLVALAIASPVIGWNAMHGWPSFALHLKERMATPSAATFASNALRTLLGQLGLFQPLAVVLLAAMAVVAVRRRKDDRYRLLALAGIPVLAFFFVMMVRVRDAEPHWTMMGWMPMAIVFGAWLDQNVERLPRAIDWLVRGSLAVSIACLSISAVHAVRPIMPLDPNSDPANETVGWDAVRGTIATDAARLGPNAVVAASHNVLCGRLQIELGDRPPVYCTSPRRTEFDFVGRRDPGNAPILFVASTRYPGGLPDRACALEDHVDVARGGRIVNTFELYSCR